ncbi:MAG: tRNA (adenosine(37)-N6)-dimethylallyltransferase MiaA [Pseudomonadota bacterium]
MKSVKRKIWLIAGPTASGKSALAMEMAAKHEAVIVNTDSMQVYAHLRLITARPSKEDETLVPHTLYGHIDPADAYSTAKWVSDVEAMLAGLDDKQPVIFVGGTGLYFKALLVGISDMPDIPEGVRERWRYRLLEDGAPKLHRLLRAQDPDGALLIKPNDGQRIVRAMEVFEATGKPLSYWQGNRRPVLGCNEKVEKIVVMPDRETTRARIKRRFETILNDGGVEEVQQLLQRKLSPSLPAMKAIGVSVCRALIEGEVDYAAALERGSIETAQYAKRQRTWFRNQFDENWRVLETSLPVP